MSLIPIEQANVVLRDASTLFPDYDGINQKYKWLWSSDLFTHIPATDDQDQPIFDYFCSCGRNVAVHDPYCVDIVQPALRMEKYYHVDDNGPLASYRNMWMLCTFVDGQYIPAMRGQACVVIPPRAGESDYVSCSQVVVRMLTEHVSKLEDEKLASKEKAERVQFPEFDERTGEMTKVPHKDSSYWQIRDRLSSAMRNTDAHIGYTKEIKDKEPVNA